MRVTIFTGLLLVCLLSAGCSSSAGFDYHLKSIVKPYLFDFLNWEFTTITNELSQRVPGGYEKADEIRLVIEYFTITEQAKALRKQIEAATADNQENDISALKAKLDQLQKQKLALQDIAERIMERQIRDTLARQGIYNPVADFRVSFPPINFQLEKPPYLLVISPRDRIESMREINLQTDLSLDEIESIEDKVDALGVSSLVEELGGLGATYPTFVTDNASLRFTLNTVTEEWLHQYLVFKPLGFLYLLDLTGLSRNYEIATMNETLAGIVSKEIGAIVYENYYAPYERQNTPPQQKEPEFDFNREMRQIRKRVDEYLAHGQIEQAEQFMEERRQYLASKGYYIRKLNQAYFAFHGTYADRPAFLNPIGIDLKKLRARSPSLKAFLETAAAMTSRQHLRESVQ